jgi:hypothetical protein
MSTKFGICALLSDVMNARECLQGRSETCHYLQEHVLSCKLTTNLKPLPPNAVTLGTSSELCTTSKFNSLVNAFNLLIMWAELIHPTSLP